MSQPNAYESPSPVPPEPKPGERQMRYMEMFSFIFENPNWMTTVLWGSLASMLGGLIVPLICYQGYLWEMVEAKHRRTTTTYPDCDLNRLGDYVSRGIWPFVVSLLLQFGMMMIFIPYAILAAIVTISVAVGIGGRSEERAIVVGVIVGLFFLMLWILFAIFSSLFATPMQLRSGLSQTIGEGFKWSWIKHFAGTMWKEMIVGSFVLLAILLPAGLVALITIIGIYPLQAIAMMASMHFAWQLYEVYLSRGGEPIPLKQPPTPGLQPPPAVRTIPPPAA